MQTTLAFWKLVAGNLAAHDSIKDVSNKESATSCE